MVASRVSAPDSRLKILHLGKYYPPYRGGMERFMADLMGASVRRDMAVAAVVHNHIPGWRGEVRTLSVAGTDGTASGTYRLYRAPSYGRFLYAPISPQFPLWLRKAVKLERPDVIDLHLPNTSAFWAMFLRETKRIAQVVHWHADVVPSEHDRRLKFAYPLYRPLEQRMLRRAARIVVTSPTYLDGSRALTPWREKCRIAPLGLDPSRLPRLSDETRAAAEQRWGNTELRILSVGRLTYYKGHEFLLAALRSLPGVSAIIVGEGERYDALARMIAEFALGDRVKLAGSLSDTQVHALLASCDCFCLPSIERTEAFGVSLVEAMAHGKPAVACDIPGSGVGWVVQDGQTGYVVPPRDPAALAGAFRDLRANRSLRLTLGNAGYKRYQKMFEIDYAADAMVRIYRELGG